MTLLNAKTMTAMATALMIFQSEAASADTKIAVWNMQAELGESIQDRLSDFGDLGSSIDPDVLVLVEVSGEVGTQAVVDQLGWPEWYSITSDFAELQSNVFFALEVSVISKVPIIGAVEYDAEPDGTHAIRTHSGTTAQIEEVELNSDGIPHFGSSLHRNDRGTMRVDLANGLSIYPVHLKSNRAPICGDPEDILDLLDESGFDVSDALRTQLETATETGFRSATLQHKSNALKRERVMAAVVREAEAAVADGRIPVILGDYNTAYEPGKKGSDPADCDLKAFSCAKAPFPAAACSDGDGYDDTLGILDSALVGPTTWAVLSKDLGRTYDDEDFADKAIDHIAVPDQDADRFSIATKSDATFGSDHYVVITTYSGE